MSTTPNASPVKALSHIAIAVREAEPLVQTLVASLGATRGGEEVRHFMGTSTFAEYTVMPEIALAVVNPPLRVLHRPGHFVDAVHRLLHDVISGKPCEVIPIAELVFHVGPFGLALAHP